MKYFVTTMLLLLHCLLAAQYSLTGRIINEHSEALSGATIVLLSMPDTLMSSFALSGEDGRFRVDDVKEGEYLLQISFLAHTTYLKPLQFDWSKKQWDLGVITLSESSEMLQEIKIQADHIPMGIRGDTISYNASAFRTRPNANVEELLKQLPGIEVEKNGSIKAQGENVENVLVDGKEFFDGNPTMATRNLQAEAIDKVEVYDKKSEIAEFTGIDDGDDEKTINLKLKEDHKKGGFGNVDLAGGTDENYDSKINYFRFSPTTQISAIFSANDINKETFSFSDRIELMGGLGSVISAGGFELSGYRGIPDGLNESLSAGLNINSDLSSQLKLRSHYIFNRTENLLDQQSQIEGLSDAFRYLNLDSLLSETTNKRHQLNTRLDFKVNSLSEFRFENNFSFDDRFLLRNSRSDYYKAQIPLGVNSSGFNSSGEGFGFDTRTQFRRKFTKKGRSLIATLVFKRDTDNRMDRVTSVNRIEDNFREIYQNQEYSNRSNQYGINTAFTEPLSSRMWLGLSYDLNRNDEIPIREYYDLIDDRLELNEDLSAEYQKQYTYQRAGVNVRHKKGGLNLNAAINGQLTQLTGIINQTENRIEKSFKHLIPSFNLEYEFSGMRSISFYYNSSIVAPQLDQLAPLPDNSNASLSYVGNPDLNPQYDHRFSLNYHGFDNFNFSSLFARLSATLSRDRIVYKTSVDQNLFQIIEPVNTDKYHDLSVYLSFSRPFRPLQLKYSVSVSGRIAEFDSYINKLSSNVVDQNTNIRLKLSNRKTNIILVETGINWTRNHREFGIDPSFNQSYHSLDYFVETELYIPGGWTFSSSLNYTSYSSGYFTSVPNYYLWNASLRKLLFNDKLELSVSAFDLLDQNIGYRRRGDSQSLRQVNYKTLGQFIMLGLNYKIGKNRNDDEGGVRIEME